MSKKSPLPKDTEMVEEDGPEDIGLGAPVASAAVEKAEALTVDELTAPPPQKATTREAFLEKWTIPEGGWPPRQFQTQAEKAEFARRKPLPLERLT
jgi:hypothetical protein